ncbi:uncharacterized protein LOC144703401 [Wolffia australiana]
MEKIQKDAAAPDTQKKKDDEMKDILELGETVSDHTDKMPFRTRADPSEKMKFFDFGKIDDFEFDAEFGKVPSFKLDMPDIDFSSPKRRSTNSREQAAGEALLGKPENGSGFSFSFDFNELNSFDIDTNMTEEEDKRKKKHDNKGFDLSRSGLSDISKMKITDKGNSEDLVRIKVEAHKRVDRDNSSASELEQSGRVKEFPTGLSKPKANGRNPPERTLKLGSHMLNDGNPVKETRWASRNLLQLPESTKTRTETMSQSIAIADELINKKASAESASFSSMSGVEQTDKLIPVEENTGSKDINPTMANERERSTALSTENLPGDAIGPRRKILNFIPNEASKMHKTVEKRSGPINQDQLRSGLKLHLSVNRDSPKEMEDKGTNGHMLLSRNSEVSGSSLNTLTTPKHLHCISNVKREASSPRYNSFKGDRTVDVTQGGSPTPGRNRFFDRSLKKESLSAVSHRNDDDCASRVTKSVLAQSSAVAIETRPESNSKGDVAAALKAPPLLSLSHNFERRVGLQSPLPYLKRKSIEVDPASSMAPKRSLPSPSESRKFAAVSPTNDLGLSEFLKDEKPETSTDYLDLNNLLDKSSANDIEISTLEENDGIIEKAEACAKELENICSMLRKKHEEAKDLLVRAIVTNNSLLMLDHPLYHEKISFDSHFLISLHIL